MDWIWSLLLFGGLMFVMNRMGISCCGGVSPGGSATAENGGSKEETTRLSPGSKEVQPESVSSGEGGKRG